MAQKLVIRYVPTNDFYFLIQGSCFLTSTILLAKVIANLGLIFSHMYQAKLF